MKVFNQSGHAFVLGTLRMEPMKFTQIPEENEERVTALIKEYPTELMSEGDVNLTTKNAKASLAEKDKEIAKLRAQVANLTKLLTDSPEIDNAARAELAEARVKELEEQLAAKPAKQPKAPKASNVIE
jgi:uncharacterized protein involved in exopolysaccharide biosynthesis